MADVVAIYTRVSSEDLARGGRSPPADRKADTPHRGKTPATIYPILWMSAKTQSAWIIGQGARPDTV